MKMYIDVLLLFCMANTVFLHDGIPCYPCTCDPLDDHDGLFEMVCVDIRVTDESFAGIDALYANSTYRVEFASTDIVDLDGTVADEPYIKSDIIILNSPWRISTFGDMIVCERPPSRAPGTNSYAAYRARLHAPPFDDKVTSRTQRYIGMNHLNNNNDTYVFNFQYNIQYIPYIQYTEICHVQCNIVCPCKYSISN